MTGIVGDQDRHSDNDALSEYMPIGVEASFEGDTLVREYIVNLWSAIGEGDLPGASLGVQPIW